ncbi:MAG: hypothetical protein Q8891_00900 [Bacteroidota bacterium]|nr:hypothetical protein [Bacteroidota bacterium]
MEFMVDLDYRGRKQNEWNLKDKAHYVALYNTIILNTCSFLDEYNKKFLLNSEPEFHERILQIKKIARPAFKKLDEWKELRQYRNHMIAHNFRVDGDEFSFYMLGQYNAPRTYNDLVMLRKYLAMINTVIMEEFKDMMPHINNFVDSFEVKEQQISYDNIEEDIKSLVDNINGLCLENAKPYRLPLDYFMVL